jgi:predicted transcriptional regulator
MKYRSRTDIVSQILEAANSGATKTRIMYEAFLSYSQLTGYLGLLLTNGLLDYQEGEAKFRTTSKGVKFLEISNQMGKLTGPMLERVK